MTKKTIPLTPISSSQIKAAGHDPESGDLVVEFRSGGTYRYSNVPAEAAAQFLAAESVGKHFHAHIRGKFASERIDNKEKAK